MVLRTVFIMTLLVIPACGPDPELEPDGISDKGDHNFTKLSGELSAQADRTPWSGYYWSMANGELVLGWKDGQGRKLWTEKQVRDFVECIHDYSARCTSLLKEMAGDRAKQLSPLMKFDLYVRRLLEEKYGAGGVSATSYSQAAKWELEQHYIGDNEDHRYWSARGYAGKCIGWALSTMDYDEPTREVEILGILFRPADIKGLLAALYNGAQFFIPEELVMGNEYRDNESYTSPQEHYEDVLPQDFVKALFATINQGTILEGDLEPDDGVWNYPIYRYDLKWKRAKKTATTLSVKTTIHYADDEVGIDDVFSTSEPRSDLLSRTLSFSLEVPSHWDGDLTKATSGKWSEESLSQHPDALILGIEPNWRSEIYDYKNSQMNQEANFQLMKRFRSSGNTWVPFIDELLGAYYRE